MAPEHLVCPSCAREHSASERFCEACGMPLVHATDAASSSHRPWKGKREHPASERQRRARKIKPQYTEGELVKVARASDQPQAEFIANLLLEEGIPCVLRNSIGGYSPMVGPREVLVPESAAEAAREALAYERP
jgi:Putative prokaryotic signal transducing protein